MGGLKKWFSEKWVDIGSPKKGGGYKECGRKSAKSSKRKCPKCVPAAKAARMTESQKRSKKKEQIRDQKSEKFLAGKGFDEGGFSKVGNHDLMGSQLVGEIDGQSVSAKGSLKYYEDLL